MDAALRARARQSHRASIQQERQRRSLESWRCVEEEELEEEDGAEDGAQPSSSWKGRAEVRRQPLSSSWHYLQDRAAAQAPASPGW